MRVLFELLVQNLTNLQNLSLVLFWVLALIPLLDTDNRRELLDKDFWQFWRFSIFRGKHFFLRSVSYSSLHKSPGIPWKSLTVKLGKFFKNFSNKIFPCQSFSKYTFTRYWQNLSTVSWLNSPGSPSRYIDTSSSIFEFNWSLSIQSGSFS